VAPSNLIQQATRLRRIIDRQGEHLLEEAMANLLKNGDITRHLKKANKLYHERRDLFCDLLTQQLGNHISFKIPDGGFAIWMKYLNGLKPKDVAEKAATMGLAISAGKDYYHDKTFESQHIRIGFASMNLREMEQATEILTRAVKKLA
jgi:GntR family transcriptional regulator/MocR family aminotransferase